VERTQGVPDMRARFMVLEQIREHGRGFVRLIGFAFFGKPSQRRSGRSLFFRSSLKPGAPGTFTFTVKATSL